MSQLLQCPVLAISCDSKTMHNVLAETDCLSLSFRFFNHVFQAQVICTILAIITMLTLARNTVGHYTRPPCSAVGDAMYLLTVCLCVHSSLLLCQLEC